MKAIRRLAPALAVATVIVAGAPGSALLDSPASASTARTAKAQRRSNVLVTTRTVIPKVQRTVHSTGYATYTFAAPAGRRILTASARIVGAQRHAVAIRGRTVSSDLQHYTVSLVFPGEQGKPGRLVVRLVTAA
jgi:hypothetical protein